MNEREIRHTTGTPDAGDIRLYWGVSRVSLIGEFSVSSTDSVTFNGFQDNVFRIVMPENVRSLDCKYGVCLFRVARGAMTRTLITLDVFT